MYTFNEQWVQLGKLFDFFVLNVLLFYLLKCNFVTFESNDKRLRLVFCIFFFFILFFSGNSFKLKFKISVHDGLGKKLTNKRAKLVSPHI